MSLQCVAMKSIGNNMDVPTKSSPTSYRFSPELLATLDILVSEINPFPQKEGLKTKTGYLEAGLANTLYMKMHKHLNPKQLHSCRTPGELFRLFIMFAKAQAGREGYGFTSKDRKARFVFGPKQETDWNVNSETGEF